MALTISTFPGLQLRGGAMPQAPMLDPACTTQTIALGTQSTAIAGPCLVCLTAGELSRVTMQKVPGYAAPAATAGTVLQGGVERYFELPKGVSYISVVAG